MGKKLLVFIFCSLILSSCAPISESSNFDNEIVSTNNNTLATLSESETISEESLATSSIYEDNSDNETKPVEDDVLDYLIINDSDKESAKVVKQFVKAIKDSDYESIKSLLYLGENSVITVNDIKTWIENSDLNILKNNDKAHVRMYYENNGVLMTEVVYGDDANKENINVYLDLDENGHWIPRMENLYRTVNMVFRLGGNLKIDNIDLGQILSIDNQYQISLIVPNRELHIEYSTDKFGVLKSDIFVEDKKVSYNIDLQLPADKQVLALSEFKAIFNNVLTGINNNEKNDSFYSKYFSDNINKSQLNNFINQLSSLQKQYNITSDITCENLSLSRLDNSLIINDSTLSLIVNFKLSFDSPSSSGIEKRNIEVDLEIQNDGSYKIGNIFM